MPADKGFDRSKRPLHARCGAGLPRCSLSSVRSSAAGAADGAKADILSATDRSALTGNSLQDDVVEATADLARDQLAGVGRAQRTAGAGRAQRTAGAGRAQRTEGRGGRRGRRGGAGERARHATAGRYEGMTKVQLSEELSDRGLKKSGKVDELRQRLIDDDLEGADS